MRTKLARRLKDRRGFTLIELMMVVAVIIILAAVLIPRIGAARKEAKYTGVLQNLNTVQGVVEAMIDKNKYQSSGGDDRLADDLESKLEGIDPRLANPFSGSTTVDQFSADTAITNQPVVAIVNDDPSSTAQILGATGTVVAYVYRDSGQTVAVLHPFDGAGNRMDSDGRIIRP